MTSCVNTIIRMNFASWYKVFKWLLRKQEPLPQYSTVFGFSLYMCVWVHSICWCVHPHFPWDQRRLSHVLFSFPSETGFLLDLELSSSVFVFFTCFSVFPLHPPVLVPQTHTCSSCVRACVLGIWTRVIKLAQQALLKLMPHLIPHPAVWSLKESICVNGLYYQPHVDLCVLPDCCS